MYRLRRRTGGERARRAPGWVAGAEGFWPGDAVLGPGECVGPVWHGPEWTEELAVLEHTPTGSRLCVVLEECEPWDMTEAELVEAVAATERQIAWAAARQHAYVQELNERRRDLDEHEDPADDIAARLAITRHAAGVLVRRAEALCRSPEVATALEHGRVDVRKVDALMDATEGLTDIEARTIHRALLPQADKITARQLGNRAKKAALGVDGALAATRQQEAASQRCVTLTPAPDAMAWLSFYLPAEDAVAAFTALDRLAGDPGPGDDRPVGARRVDVLTDILGTVLATGQAPDGTPVPSPQGARPHLVVTIERSTLEGANAHPAHLDGYGAIPATVARRIAQHATTSSIEVDPVTGRHLGPVPEQAAAGTGEHGDLAHDGADAPAGTTDVDRTVADRADRGADTADAASPAPGQPPPDTGTAEHHTAEPAGAHAHAPDPDSAEPDWSDPATTTATGTATATAEHDRSRSPVLPAPHTSTDSPGPPAAPPPDPADPHALVTWVRTQRDPSRPQDLLRDELGILVSDAYAPSIRLRRLVMDRDRTCRFPMCSVPARRCQLDHVIPFDPDLPAWAQTTEANLHLLCRHHHTLKTRKRWTVERDHRDATTTWTSPTGHTYRRAPQAMIDGPLMADLHRERRHLARLTYRELHPGFRTKARIKRAPVGFIPMPNEMSDPPPSPAALAHPRKAGTRREPSTDEETPPLDDPPF